TFLFIESHKIMKRVLINENGEVIRDWKKLEQAVLKKGELTQEEKEVALTHTANFLGRTFDEVKNVYPFFAIEQNENRFLNIIYFLGKIAIEEVIEDNQRIITFSPVLRESLGHHIHGEQWAYRIKQTLQEKGLLERPIHIISANMHSVMNSLFAPNALATEFSKKKPMEVFESLSISTNFKLREKVTKTTLAEGMIFIEDQSGTNIDVQIIDTAKIKNSTFTKEINDLEDSKKPIIVVMDYAFGEQAYETMDELLKPFVDEHKERHFLNVVSISIMGKAGILDGGKGDIMIPTAHVFEGTADNYPFKNKLDKSLFKDDDVKVCTGTMISVL